MIRSASAGDAAQICAIYNPYVSQTVVTFEERPVAVDAMAERILGAVCSLPWLVRTRRRRLLGFAYARKWKERSAYRYAVETTIYLRPDAAGRGFGPQLYAALLLELRKRLLHAAVGIIALPNPASVALHEKLGFENIGRLREIGRKFDRWVDVGYWQLLL